MIPGFLDVSPSPKTNYFYRWRDQDIQHIPRKSQIILKTNIYINIETLGIHFSILEKATHLTNSRESWIWDQYLPENMKRSFCNMGALKFRNFETTTPRNFETEIKTENQKSQTNQLFK